jgi:hypothetical protein
LAVEKEQHWLTYGRLYKTKEHVKELQEELDLLDRDSDLVLQTLEILTDGAPFAAIRLCEEGELESRVGYSRIQRLKRSLLRDP